MAQSASTPHRGFTLPELLTVLAIVAVAAALLFPVFRASKAAAYRTTCATYFKQDQLATSLYLMDYDERFMPVNHNPGSIPNPREDRTWVQLLLPYTSNFSMFLCPSDSGRERDTEAIFDAEIVPGDTFVRFYNASLRVNHGYNYLYYSPVVLGARGWEVHTRSMSVIENPSKALLFADSVHDLDKGGNPYGGGSYVVIPPCRFALIGGRIVDTFRVPPGARLFTASEGWVLDDPITALRYGLAWPWHDGRLNIARAGGGTIALSPNELAAGCDVRERWAGLIQGSGRYFWGGY